MQHDADGKPLPHTAKVVRPPYMEERVQQIMQEGLDTALDELGDNIDMETHGAAVHQVLMARAAELQPIITKHQAELANKSVDETALFLLLKLRAADGAAA